MIKTYLQPFFFLLLLSCWACAESNSSTNTSTAEKPTTETDDTAAPTASKKRIIFFGNSLTAAYGLDPEEGFVAIIQEKIEALGLDYEAVNLGVSGETTADGDSRINWVAKQKIDVFVLELGGNDALRGIDPTVTHKNLQNIIDKVKKKYPDAKIVLAGMEAPPNMGTKYTSDFRNLYKRLAKENELSFIPFVLDKVGGIPELNQADGIHPTAEGNKIMAETIWNVLKDVL